MAVLYSTGDFWGFHLALQITVFSFHPASALGRLDCLACAILRVNLEVCTWCMCLLLCRSYASCSQSERIIVDELTISARCSVLFFVSIGCPCQVLLQFVPVRCSYQQADRWYVLFESAYQVYLASDPIRFSNRELLLGVLPGLCQMMVYVAPIRAV